ncbi:hypothetical protein DFH06DRAFT_1442719 [Mycena polygramma]|nr:hypothetical protein DFH06DRAFT_1442719 [Mycena polygramma]
MRETHEECFVCKRNDVRDQYFLNYAALAHLVEEHAGDIGKGGQRNGRAGVEGEEDGGKNVSATGIGLSGRRRRISHPRYLKRSVPVVVVVEIPPPQAPSPPLPRAGGDPAVAALHASFLARLASLAPNPSTALPAARAAIRSFRASESSARDLISTLWSVGPAAGGWEHGYGAPPESLDGEGFGRRKVSLAAPPPPFRLPFPFPSIPFLFSPDTPHAPSLILLRALRLPTYPPSSFAPLDASRSPTPKHLPPDGLAEIGCAALSWSPSLE